MKKTGYTKVDRAAFESVKTLIANRVPYAVIARVTGRSLTTIKRIEKTNSVEEYRDLTTRWNRVYKEKRQATDLSTSPSSQEAPTFEELIATPPVQVAKPNELARIAAALERLADAWEASPKRRLF